MSSILIKVFLALSILVCFIIVFLNIVWIVKLLNELCKLLKNYKCSKKGTDNRPIYRDVDSIPIVDSYSYRTDIVRFIALITICALEIWQVLFSCFYRLIFITSPKQIPQNNIIQGEDSNTTCHFNFMKFFQHPYLLYLLNIELYSYLLLLILLTVLTRFLSARSLRHPVRTSLIRYIAWLLIQYLFIALSSTTYTYPLYFFLFPTFSLINLFLLVRESVVLCNVLKTNAKNIRLYSYNSRRLFNEQLLIYKHYKLFRMLLLLSLFVSVVFIFLQLSSTGFKLVLCQIKNFTHPSAAPELIMKVLSYLDPLLILLFLLSYGLPLWVYSAANIIVVLMKRYSARKKQYRFNYFNTNVPLLRSLI